MLIAALIVAGIYAVTFTVIQPPISHAIGRLLFR